jgi:hypothetical protein
MLVIKAEQAPLKIVVVKEMDAQGVVLLATTGGSGTGAVTFSLVSGAATLTTDGKLTVKSAGTLVIMATKEGDCDYFPVSTRSIMIVDSGKPNPPKPPPTGDATSLVGVAVMAVIGTALTTTARLRRRES